MLFACKGKETISMSIERIALEANSIRVLVDVHTKYVNFELGDDINLEFDDSLQYACNVTTVSRDRNGLLGSCGGLLFLWTGGGVPISPVNQFTFSVEKSLTPVAGEKDVMCRRSKRTREQHVA